MKRQISGTDGALIGIDFRPANQKLYGVSKSGVIYTIDPSSAVATRVSQMNVAIEGSTFGFDFNPNADRLRIVSDADQNLRVNVDNGETTQDARLAYADNDPNRGQNPRVGGAGTRTPTRIRTRPRPCSTSTRRRTASSGRTRRTTESSTRSVGFASTQARSSASTSVPTTVPWRPSRQAAARPACTR